VRERGLAQVSDTGALEALVDQAIAANPQSVEDYRKARRRRCSSWWGRSCG
jgi:aspartyl-tRNA(Asn)/glutamyl-tRNA(Gln) amidotransferase subunit B